MDTENVDPQTVRRRRPAPPLTPPCRSARALAVVPPQEGNSSQPPVASQKPKPKRFKRETLTEPQKIKRAMDRPPPLQDMLPMMIISLFNLVAQAKSVRGATEREAPHRSAPSLTRACLPARSATRTTWCRCCCPSSSPPCPSFASRAPCAAGPASPPLASVPLSSCAAQNLGGAYAGAVVFAQAANMTGLLLSETGGNKSGMLDFFLDAAQAYMKLYGEEIMLTDFTTEALCSAMADNAGRVLVTMHEAKKLFLTDQYKKQGDGKERLMEFQAAPCPLPCHALPDVTLIPQILVHLIFLRPRHTRHRVGVRAPPRPGPAQDGVKGAVARKGGALEAESEPEAKTEDEGSDSEGEAERKRKKKKDKKKKKRSVRIEHVRAHLAVAGCSHPQLGESSITHEESDPIGCTARMAMALLPAIAYPLPAKAKLIELMQGINKCTSRPRPRPAHASPGPLSRPPLLARARAGSPRWSWSWPSSPRSAR